MRDFEQRNPVSLYLHFPFCERKCRYCDFLSGPASEEAREEYVQFLLREIAVRGAPARADGAKSKVVAGTPARAAVAPAGATAGEQAGEAGAPARADGAKSEVVAGTPARATVDTIFIGGGTPSLMTPSQMERVMGAVRDSFAVLPDAEISMEVNPGTADLSKLRAYRSVGVNRLSIGVQSFDNGELRMLGRIHTADRAREIFRAARAAGFDNLNLDLMSALPGQTMDSWAATLREACALGPEHISAYSLILEEGTPLASMFAAGRLPDLPSDEEDREMYHFTGEFLAANGYHRYEISNYAREGRACRHNIGYWTGHEYLGLGLGASSDFGGERFRNPEEMAAYRRAIETCEKGDGGGGAGVGAGTPGGDEALRCERQEMTVADRMEEFMFLGLRLTEGVSESAFERRFGKTLSDVYGDVIRRHLRQGVIARDPERGRIALTEYGLDVANHVMAEYLL